MTNKTRVAKGPLQILYGVDNYDPCEDPPASMKKIVPECVYFYFTDRKGVLHTFFYDYYGPIDSDKKLKGIIALLVDNMRQPMLVENGVPYPDYNVYPIPEIKQPLVWRRKSYLVFMSDDENATYDIHCVDVDDDNHAIFSGRMIQVEVEG